jgi:xylulokinase
MIAATDPVLIGVDVGSSGAKATVIDGRGFILAASDTHSYPTCYPRPGWAEQNPEDWYNAAGAAIRQCVESGRFDARQVAGLAVVGPAHNVALLDAEGALLGPTLHWSDLRSAPQCERLEALCGGQIFATTGQRVNPSWTLAQLLWLKENDPNRWAKLRGILATKDYVRYRLTGEYATDVYDAIGLQLYDLQTDGWSAEMCRLLDFPLEWLPTVKPIFSVDGGLLPTAAARIGLLPGTPVAVGSADVTVEAFGVGAVEPGCAIVKLGTAGCINLVTAAPRPSERTLTYRHVTGDCGFTIAATNSGTGALAWFRSTFFDEKTEFDHITDLAAQAPPGAAGLLFHPYLRGERSPYWNPHLRGDFVGIGAHHALSHFARAVMEGVAFSLRDCRDAVQALGEPILSYRIVGGGSRSPLWRRILCDVLGAPLIVPAVEAEADSAATYGAALLAGVAVGLFPDWQTALTTCVRQETVLEPDPAIHARYSRYFAIFQEVTRDLAIHDRRLAELAEEI